MQRVVVPGIAAGVGMLLVSLGGGFLLSFLTPSVTREYTNSAIFRPWNDPLMLLYFLHPFVFGIVLAFVWRKLSKFFSGTSFYRFGFVYWLVTTLPGMLISYSTFQISFLMVISWSISSLFQILVGLWIVRKMTK